MNRQEFVTFAAKNNIQRIQLKEILGARAFQRLILSAGPTQKIPNEAVCKVKDFLSIDEPAEETKTTNIACPIAKQDLIAYIAKRNISRNQVKQAIGDDDYNRFIRSDYSPEILPANIVSRIMGSRH